MDRCSKQECTCTYRGKKYGTVLSFSSHTPVNLSTMEDGLVSLPSYIGFGKSTFGIPILNDTVDLVANGGILTNFSVLLPRSVVITDISATFNITNALSLVGSKLSITAQIYYSSKNSTQMKPLKNTSVPLSPDYSGIITIGSISSGTASSLSIPVDANSRLLMVFTASATGLSLDNTIIGYANASVFME